MDRLAQFSRAQGGPSDSAAHRAIRRWSARANLHIVQQQDRPLLRQATRKTPNGPSCCTPRQLPQPLVPGASTAVSCSAVELHARVVEVTKPDGERLTFEYEQI
jgi:hypothetical protein